MPDELIGRFRIREVKRRVGRGVSYLAQDPQAGAVLLRVFPPLGDEGIEWVERIRHQMNLLRHVEAAHVVNFSDIGVIDQLTYVSRPFLEGTTLADVLSHRLEVTDAVEIGRRVSSTIARVHAAGIVHGGLNPSNVLLSGHDVYVVDFGLAFPEPNPPNRRDDLAALGGLLYELFTGMPPARGGVPDPCAVNPNLPATAGSLVRDLLNGQVEDAADVAPRLTMLRSGGPIMGLTPAVTPKGAWSGARVVNTWFEGDAPFPPLRAGQRYLFHFNIGAPRADTTGRTTIFVEPDFGTHDHLVLLVSLFSEDFSFEKRQQIVILQRTGDTDILTTGVTPRHAGPCRLEIVISLARELDVLQQLYVDIDVAPAPATADARVATGAPRA